MVIGGLTCTLALQELAEAVARVLMLAGGEQRGRDLLLNLLVAGVIVRGQELFDPLDVVRLHAPCELHGVVDVQCHVAVDHDGKIVAHRLSHLGHTRDVIAHALICVREATSVKARASVSHLPPAAGPYGKGNLAPAKPIFLARCGSAVVAYTGRRPFCSARQRAPDVGS
jgi:hypothetical protein